MRALNNRENQSQLGLNNQQVYVAPIRSLHALPVGKKKFKLNAAQKLCYSLAILALVIGLVQFTRCCLDNMGKLQILISQSHEVKSNLQQAATDNGSLKDQIRLYHSPMGAETIARERLNFVRGDEVLIQVFPTRVSSNNQVASSQAH